MAIKILMDLSHNESLTTFPDSTFESEEVLFDFVNMNEDLSDIDVLKKHQLLILGNPRPRKDPTEMLFTPKELKALKTYVKDGGSLLLSVSSKGDYESANSIGSIRVLNSLTGIKQFPDGIVYLPKNGNFYQKNTNFVFEKFPNHPIFTSLKSKDALVFGKCTYFILDEQEPPQTLIASETPALYYAIKRDYRDKVGNVPLLTEKTVGKGSVVTIATSEIFTLDEERGINVKSNKKFVKNLITYLAKN